MIHARLPYRRIVLIGILFGIFAGMSACGGGGAGEGTGGAASQQASIDALREDIAEIKQTQAQILAALVSLKKDKRPQQAAAAAADDGGDPGREPAVHRIPISFSPHKGNEVAPVTVVEFADFQCPYCQAAAGLSDQLVKEFPNDVLFVFKNYPLGRHADAMRAATAAWAAQMQGKFWEMHNLIYSGDITAISDETLMGYARQLGLDMPRFEADMTSPKAAQAISFDKQFGRSLKLWGTPSFFVNGRRATDRSPEALRRMIQEEIAKRQQPAEQ